MKFTIRAQFLSLDGISTEKTETTNNWQQALGAFTIYAASPDCNFCSVTYYDGNVEKTTLQYNSVEV